MTVGIDGRLENWQRMVELVYIEREGDHCIMQKIEMLIEERIKPV